MRRYFVILGFLLIGLTAHSQILISLLLGDKLNSDGLEFGLEGGINWTQISNMDTKKFARKWNLGFYFDIRMKNQWSLYTGVLVKSNMGVNKLTENDIKFLGATTYNEEGNYAQKMNYFLVPALVKYTFKNQIYVELGPQFGLMYKSWVEYESDIDGRDAVIKEFNKDQLNKIDAGALIGLGYHPLKGTGCTIGVKYYEGFVNVYKARKGSRNRSFFVKICIPIGAGKKSKNEPESE